MGAQNNPKQFGIPDHVAMHYSQQHQRENMVAVLNEIKSHAKEYESAYQTVGDFYLRMGDGESAIASIARACRRTPRRRPSTRRASSKCSCGRQAHRGG